MIDPRLLAFFRVVATASRQWANLNRNDANTLGCFWAVSGLYALTL